MTKVFDWDKAAGILRDRGAKEASAGMSGDHWGWSSGVILREGRPMVVRGIPDSLTYLKSDRHTPVLQVENETLECWIPAEEKPAWTAQTFWPESALKIFNGEEDANGTGETERDV